MGLLSLLPFSNLFPSPTYFISFLAKRISDKPFVWESVQPAESGSPSSAFGIWRHKMETYLSLFKEASKHVQAGPESGLDSVWLLLAPRANHRTSRLHLASSFRNYNPELLGPGWKAPAMAANGSCALRGHLQKWCSHWQALRTSQLV